MFVSLGSLKYIVFKDVITLSKPSIFYISSRNLLIIKMLDYGMKILRAMRVNGIRSSDPIPARSLHISRASTTVAQSFTVNCFGNTVFIRLLAIDVIDRDRLISDVFCLAIEGLSLNMKERFFIQARLLNCTCISKMAR